MKEFGRGLRLYDTGTVAKPKKTVDAFYQTPEWRALMRDITAERGRRCEDCGTSGVRMFGDHIVEIKEGGPLLDRLNIRLLCGSCHSKKTAAARARRYHG